MPDRPKLPPIVDAVVELGVVRMRASVGPTAATAYRPRTILWVHQSSGMILHFALGQPGDDGLPFVVRSLPELVGRLGGLPRQIQLRTPTLARELRETLGPAGVEVVVRESLPMLDEAVASLMDFKKISGKPEPGLLDQPGMTLDHVIAFAEGAAAFFAARPWRHLTDDDAIVIESPPGPQGTGVAEILGAGGQTFGIGFVPTMKAHEDLREFGRLPRGGVWSLTFGNIDSIPYEDGEAWERHNLPLGGPDGFPTFLKMRTSAGFKYPTPDELAWAEGMLRAIAATTEEEIDTGRWEKQVTTQNGPATYNFSMPLLLEQMSGKAKTDPAGGFAPSRRKLESMMRSIGQQMAAHGPMDVDEANQFLESLQGKEVPFTPTTDAERAIALVDEAFEARGRRQVQLAREALKLDPNCVDALLLLADRAGDAESALPLFQQAMEAGERQLGPQLFEQEAGNFWGILETRPYMRARQQVAVNLMELGRYDEAAGHLRELLRLSPGDNQGNRYLLIHALMEENHLDEVDDLLNRSEYKDEESAEWAFSRALLAFRKDPDSPEAEARLDQAMRINRHVAPLLIGRAPMPAGAPPSYSPGSEDEAVLYVDEAAPEWQATEGALDWVEDAFEAAKKRARKAKAQSKSKPKGKGKRKS
ncbi:MAG TPA: tetratricopeptide repeat protein [Tepidisphaeraceae bacterium]|jgi:tetratricopeptide (TPR) repeat protein